MFIKISLIIALILALLGHLLTNAGSTEADNAGNSEKNQNISPPLMQDQPLIETPHRQELSASDGYSDYGLPYLTSPYNQKNAYSVNYYPIPPPPPPYVHKSHHHDHDHDHGESKKDKCKPHDYCFHDEVGDMEVKKCIRCLPTSDLQVFSLCTAMFSEWLTSGSSANPNAFESLGAAGAIPSIVNNRNGTDHCCYLQRYLNCISPVFLRNCSPCALKNVVNRHRAHMEVCHLLNKPFSQCFVDSSRASLLQSEQSIFNLNSNRFPNAL